MADHPTRVVARAVWQHLRHGPARPTWDLRTTAYAAYLQATFQQSAHLPVDQIRARFDKVGALALHPGVRRDTLTLGGVPCERTRPTRGPVERTILYFHGGGYTFCSPRSHRPLLTALAKAARAEVIAVDYRMAPEHPAPAAIDDGEAVWRAWWATHPTTPVAFAGDSAGGGLTTLLAQRLARANAPQPGALVLLSPWVDLTASSASFQTNADVDYLGHAAQVRRYAQRFAGELPLDHPTLSPALHPSPRLPPTLLQVGTAEVLHDEGVLLADRLRTAGTDLTLEAWADQIHVWHAAVDLLPTARRAIDRVGRWVRSTLPGHRALSQP